MPFKLSIPNEPIVYNLMLRKVDEDKVGLVGSKFTLQKWIDGHWVDINPTTWSTTGTNEIDMTSVYEYTFSSIRAGFYHLTEVVAPNGYVIRDANIYFKLENGIVTLTDKNGTAVISSNVDASLIEPVAPETVYTIEVKNHPGEPLPMTGGHGTLPYTLGGMAIITASCLMYGYRRRRRKGGPNKSPT